MKKRMNLWILARNLYLNPLMNVHVPVMPAHLYLLFSGTSIAYCHLRSSANKFQTTYFLYFLKYHAAYFGRQVPVFKRNLLLLLQSKVPTLIWQWRQQTFLQNWLPIQQYSVDRVLTHLTHSTSHNKIVICQKFRSSA